MTEAWLLVDGDAVRAATGARLENHALCLPSHPPLVERLAEPKARLEEVLRQAWPVAGRRRGQLPMQDLQRAIAEQVRLEQLRLVPAFQRLEKETSEVLVSLGYIRPV